MSQMSLRPTDDAKADQAGDSQSEPLEEDEIEEGGSRFLFFHVMPSWMVSFLTHIAIIIVLAVLVLPSKKERNIALEAGDQAASVLDDDISLDLDELSLDSDMEDALDTDFSEDEPMEVSSDIETMLPEATAPFELSEFGSVSESFEADAIGEMGAPNETSSRYGEAKQRALRQGASAASEQAVALALKWIVRHQLPDGGWNLDHTIGPGGFRDSPNPGLRSEARYGATALAILPLLGAGHTHLRGEHKEAVAKGIEFLKKRGRRQGRGVSYLESGGTMYSHGLVAIVFCEAYAMTQDPDLAEFAQGTVWYIEDAQDPIGGGWRYRPRERGDTSAVGWQLMALKSGKISGLDINPRTYKRTRKFLDSVSTSGGAFYGYQDPPRREFANARTAVGLLCRMYMGWDRDNPGLIDGSGAIAEEGPSVGTEANMYYNYYATQVMKHLGGRDWKDWNVKMRDFLIRSQSKAGNATGSWYFNDGHSSIAGGRLYNTSLACMTLEVYYRFLPIYGEKAASDEFQLIE